ncbi:carboxylesterase [Podospora appendiculata]|uniref:Carboxylic ester hydrolase n=1 Tax=Podospora appendiculata TaxID=314037 RepID=A0AAE0XGL3_9PEZI|nr:carboxylesterase [Podospora appendiculata]
MLSIVVLGVLTACLGLASTAWCEAGPAASKPPASKLLTVYTTNGAIKGHVATETGHIVGEYLGIPYAKPPVGDLRFAPPRRFLANNSYEAAAFGSDCPLTASKPVNYPGFTPQAQRIVNCFSSAAGTPQSEDCLTLNIWTRGTSTIKKASSPVLVFFYGGRFTVGNTNTPFYNGKHLVDSQDMVVVTVNFRLNVFGFPGAPGETQNLGLRDQRAAVRWVRDNIAGFGGDPSKIVIAGQSSGGVSVDYWAYAYPNDPIVHGIIAHSGNAFSFPSNTKAVQETNWNTVVAAVNCSSSSAADTMACMRKVDWHAIESAAAAIKPTKSNSVLRSIPAFWPTPDDDIVFDDYLGLTANGSFAKIPILFGNNDNENGYYQIAAFAQGVIPTEDQIRSFLLESFTCPVSFQAAARMKHKVSAYTYRFLADWNNTQLYPTSGAYHGVDLHMIFGASGYVSGLPTTSEQRELTKLMQKTWLAFCEDPWAGLARIGWPPYNPDYESLVQLGLDNIPKAPQAGRPFFTTKPSLYDEPCTSVTMGAVSIPAELLDE